MPACGDAGRRPSDRGAWKTDHCLVICRRPREAGDALLIRRVRSAFNEVFRAMAGPDAPWTTDSFPTPAGLATADVLRGLAGAALGTAAGAAALYMLYYAGIYALGVIGLGTGWGCSAMLRRPSRAFRILCLLLGLVGAALMEWWLHPFRENQSLLFFLTHLTDLRPATLIFIALSGVFGYWFGPSARRV